MALVDFPGFLPLPSEGFGGFGAPSFTGTLWVLDAASEKVGIVFSPFKAGDISKISIRFGTVTTGATLDVRIETVSLTTGAPTGTLWATNTNGALVVADGDDNATLTLTLTANATVARGDYVAVVVSNPAASFGNLQIVYPNQTAVAAGFGALPYPLFHNGTSWAKQDFSLIPCIGVEYSDGSYGPIFGPQPWSAVTTYSPGSGSNPNHYATRFQLPFPARVTGAWINADLAGTTKILLVGDNWNGTDGDAIALTGTLDPDVRVANAGRPGYYPFLATGDVSANTTYRLVIKPTSASVISIYSVTVGDADRWGQTSAGTQFYISKANNPNDSTDWTDTTTERLLCGLVLAGFDAGGGTLAANPLGGFVV